MSLDKIGKADQNVAIHHQAVHHREPAAAGKGGDVVVHGPKVPEGDLTQISYPPFLPLGDTQGIYKQ